jgi:hypothetical protein
VVRGVGFQSVLVQAVVSGIVVSGIYIYGIICSSGVVVQDVAKFLGVVDFKRLDFRYL